MARPAATTARPARLSTLPRDTDRDNELNPQDTGNWDFTMESMLARCREDPQGLFDSIDYTIKQRDQYSEENQRLLVQNERLRAQKEGLQEQVRELAEERDEHVNALARYAVTGREGTPAPERAPARSVKLPDPPLLTDGKEPNFEDWLLRMKDKLNANNDHYSTEALRMAYISNRTGGDAARHLAPRLRQGANRFQTADEMFDHLEAIYLDPNRLETAHTNFKRLHMKDGEDYHQFLTKFLHLAGESQVDQGNMKRELRDRLNSQLRTATLQNYMATKTFQEFSTQCSHIAQGLKGVADAESRRAGTKQKFPFPKTRSTPVTDASPTTSTTTMVATPTKLRMESPERTALRAEGKCYSCKATGHIARFCPLKKNTVKVYETAAHVDRSQHGQETSSDSGNAEP